MSNKIIKGLIVTSMLATLTNADFLGAQIGYSAWNAKTTGDIRKGGDSISLENDLGLVSQTNGFYYASFDHPLPFIPNIKLQQTNYSTNGNSTISKNLTFAGTTYNINDTLKTDLTLNQTDLTMYYRILDNWINIDLGLTIKNVDGNLKIKTTLKNSDESFDFVVPLVYSKLQLDLPFSGLSTEAEINFISYAGNTFSDIKAGLLYEFDSGIGINLGYRSEKLTIDDINDVYGTINNHGAYAGVFYHF